uniref:Uncharacterized protein n=1 Tax=Leptobrachium leishanense TaxID=445787 RepID=A0A8C5QI40_9ANUR
MAYPVASQPQATQGYVSRSKSDWHSEVFDCCEDMGICLCGTFIPCILACKVASDYGECCCLPYLGGTVLAMRTGIRERHSIPVIINILSLSFLKTTKTTLSLKKVTFLLGMCMAEKFVSFRYINHFIFRIS